MRGHLTNGHTRDERYSRVSDYKAYRDGIDRIFGKKKKKSKKKKPDETGN